MDKAEQIRLAASAVVDGDNGEQTVPEYLKSLLVALWRDAEGFSGKRPFGNSGWQHDVYAALIKAGALPGKLDSDGYVEEVNERKADALIFRGHRKAGAMRTEPQPEWLAT